MDVVIVMSSCGCIVMVSYPTSCGCIGDMVGFWGRRGFGIKDMIPDRNWHTILWIK